MDVFALKSIGAVFGAIIDQKITRVEMLVVAQDQSLVGGRAQMSLDP